MIPTADSGQTLLVAIAAALQSIRNLDGSGTVRTNARMNWTIRLDALADMLPHGSGFDNGTQIDDERSSESRIVLHTAFHHMTEHGYYAGWTEHSVIITPAFSGFNIRVTGRNRNDIKSYIESVFYTGLLEIAPAMEWKRADDPIWNKGTPMPESYTCHCGLPVHPSVKNASAIHISDCPYAAKDGSV